LLLVRRGPDLIGGLPLYQRCDGSRILGYRRIGFISTGEAENEETCPDYMDLLHAPGQAEVCLKMLADYLRQSCASWDEVDLLDISAGSPLLGWLTALPRHFHANVIPRGECPIADLTGGFEAYLQRLSKKMRQQARRLLRECQRAGAVLELATSQTETDLFFKQLIRLHQERWIAVGKPGCFASIRFTEFHRTLANLWVPAGKAVLARLIMEGKPLAVLYGFLVGSKFDFYQTGILIEDDCPLESPGTLAHLLLMNTLAGRGITQYDFLRGNSPYKERLTTTKTPLVRLRIVRPTIRYGLHKSGQLAKRAFNKTLRVVGDSVFGPSNLFRVNRSHNIS
jgi:Acetyltransferase (GNAT) domain